jgi:hypothetical protein
LVRFVLVCFGLVICCRVGLMSFNRSGKWFSWLPGVLVAAVFAAGGVAVAVGGDGEGGVVTVDPVRGI